MEEAVAIDDVIQKHFGQLQKPGVLFVRPGYKATKGIVKDEPAIVVTVTAFWLSTLFDGLYSLMLRMLGYTFSPCGSVELRHTLGQSAIMVMATVLKPLGEALTALPASDEPAGPTAGPPFGLTRHVVLPVDASTARTLVAERLDELTSLASDVASVPVASAALSHVEATLRRLAGMMAASPGRPVPRGAGT
jgi:hypothetical protein